MKRLWFASLLSLFALSVWAGPLPPQEVPEPLKPWVDWVLKGEEQQRCPFVYSDARQRRCVWPSRLMLELNPTRGQFTQSWEVFADSWLLLPGDKKHWPQQVQANGKPIAVVARDGQPAVFLQSGRYDISGRFAWERLPESLRMAANVGLVNLRINGKPIDVPDLDSQGRLWLRERDTGPKDRDQQGERLELKVFRRVVDDIPLRVVTRVELRVSGTQREVLMGPALLEGHIPQQLDSRLPARLEADGRLRVQVRPGNWRIQLTSRHPNAITELTLPEATKPWPTQEVWAFEARNELRLVEVRGLTSVDPRQTGLPNAWHQLPAYRMAVGERLRLKVIRRGDPEPEPDRLKLVRHMWLDFDGGGYTFHDQINGSMTRGWRMEVNPAIQLGRAAVDGQPQFITRLPDSEKHGVEVRRGALQLEADSRYTQGIRSLPAVGWDNDFHSVKSTLHLPPGWRLFAAGGVDNVPNAWLYNWTLLDLFIVLIITITVARLWGWPWGVLALFTLVLIWQESYDAPRYVWLNLLAAIALLRVLPVGRFSRLVTIYRNLSLLALILISIPYMVEEIRTGIFPQLDTPPQLYRPADSIAPTSSPALSPDGEVAQEELELSSIASGALYDRKAKAAVRKRAEQQLTQIDPKANVQTGPGLPNWQWRSVALNWNGPVQRDQQIKLVLLNPVTNLVLSFLRVGLLAILILLVLGVRFKPGQGIVRIAGLAIMLLVPALTALPTVARADFPPPDMLDELKTRLLEAPECLPVCAQSPRLRLNLERTQLTGRMEIHTQHAVAVPLPAHPQQWWPEDVLLDGKPAQGLARSRNGQLWIQLQPGTHQVLFRGAMPRRNTFQLPLPLTPRRVEVEARGWRVDGVHEDGVPDKQLQISRSGDSATAPRFTALEPGSLPPFVRLERTLMLGLDWQVHNRLVRLSPPGNAIVLEVPLLHGESVLTEDVRSQDGRVLISLSPRQSQTSWTSSLDKQAQLKLIAPQTTEWTEIWRVDVSPIWHLTSTGIPVVHHKNPQGRWLPEWRPWPDEGVTLSVTRPEGVKGQTLTIDRSMLNVVPGNRATDARLQLSLRSSQGGQHSIELPSDADLQNVTINGVAQPIRQEGNRVTVPIVPGKQELQFNWRQGIGMQARFITPDVDLGVASVNSQVQLELARDHWVLLTGGPRMGPAVLFWGVLIVVLMLAVGLSRVTLTPLRFTHWLLLGVGLTQISIILAAFIVGWLLALGLRERMNVNKPHPLMFNLTQIGLVGLTVLALVFLFVAVRQGLLGLPEMQIGGNFSSAHNLSWFQDRSESSLPQAWVIAVPLLVYRVLMLMWALWLAFALLHWLRWGWQCFSSKTMWRRWRHEKKQAKTPPAAKPSAET